jgi:glycosyltransferase involved in cell wall biosynthesis
MFPANGASVSIPLRGQAYAEALRGRVRAELSSVATSKGKSRGGIVRSLWEFHRRWLHDGPNGRVTHVLIPWIAWEGADVVCIHDLAPSILGGVYSQVGDHYVRAAARRAKRIDCASQFTRDLLAKRFGPKIAEKCFVTLIPIPPMPITRLPPLYDVIWVGDSCPNKGLERLLAALPERRPAAIVVRLRSARHESVVGDWVGAARRRGASVTVFTDLSAGDLDTLYRQSRVYVSTSDYEGFHIPPLEHFLRGGAVLLPELRPYTDSYPASSVCWYSSDATRSQLRAKILEATDWPTPQPGAVRAVACRHSYERAADTLVANYERVAG